MTGYTIVCLLGSIVALAASVSAQRFDAVSIHPYPVPMPMGVHMAPMVIHPGYMRLSDTTLAGLIEFAYFTSSEHLDGPSWITINHFDIEARATTPATMAQMKPMMQTMLRERFGLTLRNELRPEDVLQPQIGKSGARMARAQEGQAQRADATNVVTLPDFAAALTRMLKQAEVDKTGLSGYYDVSGLWAAIKGTAVAYGPDARDAFAQPLQSKLGLVLVKGKDNAVFLHYIERSSAVLKLMDCGSIGGDCNRAGEVYLRRDSPQAAWVAGAVRRV